MLSIIIVVLSAVVIAGHATSWKYKWSTAAPLDILFGDESPDLTLSRRSDVGTQADSTSTTVQAESDSTDAQQNQTNGESKRRRATFAEPVVQSSHSAVEPITAVSAASAQWVCDDMQCVLLHANHMSPV